MLIMSKSIEVQAEHKYSVHIGVNWQKSFTELKSKYLRNLIFIPESLRTIVEIDGLLNENDHLHFIPDGEGAKEISSAASMWDAASRAGIRRGDAMWGIGGGSTTDVSGFIAATWLRGVDWFAIPTTLAGMVDASVGGKTGINSSAGKNLIGSFHSPQSVLIDISFLDSLSDRDIAAGLAEVIKTGFIGDTQILNILSSVKGVTEVKPHLLELVERSVAVKASVVSSDFKESKLREVLNYGHTLGHAVEKREKYQLRHGEAVAIGLVFAAELSALLLDLNPEVVAEHRSLLTKFGLPTSYPLSARAELEELMQGDKKSRDSRLRFIGLLDRGRPEWIEQVSSDDLLAAYGRISQ